MNQEQVARKNLDSREYSTLRQATEKISNSLNRRLSGHLEVLRPLFFARKLLGHYIKSAFNEEVPNSDLAFNELQKQYSAVCERPFGLDKKLQPPLPPITNQLEATPYQYPIYLEGSDNKHISITSPTSWILSYQGNCNLNRLKAIVSGSEPRDPDDMRQALINHIVPVIFLKQFPDLKRLLEDLRYEVKTRELAELGGLPVVTLNAPAETFLPPDDFILQITQLSGVAAFQEIIDLEAVENIRDSFKDSLKSLIR